MHRAVRVSILGARRVVAAAELVADAEAEVEQGREADEEADDGVEAFEGDDGDPAEGAVIGDGVAEKRGEGRKKGVHGSAVRRENENEAEDGLLVLAATSEGTEVGYEAVSLRAQTGEVTRMSSLQSTARMSERAESSR